MTTEERLARLESRLTNANRRNRWLIVIVGLAAVVLVVFATRKPVTADTTAPTPVDRRILKATSFILVDEKGKGRAALFMSNDWPLLAFYDEKGIMRVGVAATKTQSGIALYDPKGTGRLAITATEKDPMLTICDDKGRARVSLQVGPKKAALGFFDEKGNIRIGLSMLQDGAGLTLHGPKQRPLAGIIVRKGNPMVALFDQKGNIIWGGP